MMIIKKSVSMTPEEQEKIIISAKNLWQSGNKNKAIDMLYEAIPIELRSKWISRILLQLQKLIPESELIGKIVEFAQQDVDWNTFRYPEYILYAGDDARHMQENQLFNHIGTVAYYLGKQVINAKGFRAPFDHQNLFLVPELLEQIAELTDDAEDFLDSVWA